MPVVVVKGMRAAPKETAVVCSHNTENWHKFAWCNSRMYRISVVQVAWQPSMTSHTHVEVRTLNRRNSAIPLKLAWPVATVSDVAKLWEYLRDTPDVTGETVTI